MTATIAIPAEPARLEVGRCVIATLRVLGRRGLTLLMLAAPFVFLPECLAALLPPELATVRLAAGLPGLIFVGGATQIAYADLASERPVGFGEAMSKGARKFGSLWGVGLISNIGAALGALLLIVPGVILLVAWMSASSAVVVEDKTAFEALDRSWQLSRGSRWRLAALLGIALGAVVLILLLVFVVAIVLVLLFGEANATRVSDFVVSPLVSVVVLAITTVGSTAAYVGLRFVKEGSAGDVAATFD
jgi:hypothetical protein